VLHRALRWTGPPARRSSPTWPAAAERGSSLSAFIDPVAWALDVSASRPGTVGPVKRDVLAQYRARLMEVPPRPRRRRDRGSKAIVDLGEARRILLAAEWADV
jgi:hypothetical protein